MRFAIGTGLRRWSVLLLPVFAVAAATGRAQTSEQADQPVLPATLGPYNGHFLAGGRGLTKTVPPESPATSRRREAVQDPVLSSAAPWTLSTWVQVDAATANTVAIGGVGEPGAEDTRTFALVDGKAALRLGPAQLLVAAQPLDRSQLHLLAASFDGSIVRFFVDGAQAAEAPLHAGPVAPVVSLAPVLAACAALPCAHFGGHIAELTLRREAWSAEAIAALARQKPDLSLIVFEEGSKPWPIQTVQFAGNTAPQDPATLPLPKAPPSRPHAEPLPPAQTSLTPAGAGDWELQGGWMLAEAPKVEASPEQVATPGFSTRNWLPAVVPGTVLTTLVARGIYPDPDYGLDNLAIPEKLNRQQYWYRAEFTAPAAAKGHAAKLMLGGVNYEAEVWLNGQRLGTLKGAFVRGTFDVSHVVHASGPNALAIRVSPAPHPGIPNEQSIAFGAGLNGGAMALDGPTFMATEGWDWFPPMHDRNTGLWQGVHLLMGGDVAIGDPQVITKLPLPDITQADVRVNVPLENESERAVRGVLTASFEGVTVRKEVEVAPGKTTVTLAPTEFRQLHLDHPRLWWPNGYGKPELYHLKLQFASEGAPLSEKTLRFGVREVTYELSLLDGTGALRRLEYDPTVGRDAPAPQVDVTHEGMRQVPDGWAASVASGQDSAEALRPVDDTRATPYLILKVNGVRIAVRGGSWGMDDSRKRVSREHLEPFFRFDQEANLNIIRNWQGQDTEETFYELADEYGLMVWNDFWEVTTDSNSEAEDPQLFLANAADTIARYRNHPSIVMWCGRNEGVPQPILNQGLIALTHTLDGTRYYSPSSNQVNLQTSGPYSYEDPADYFTKLDRGFAVEVGTPSLPTLEWFSRWMPEADRWPISDDWAYHNWHPHDALNQHMEAQLGAADTLEDYERRAQMMNYVDYRAIFEGFNANLWAPNGGRLLWMTQPAWPSTLWGILSSDYDTQASFYGTKKACEPVHVQLDAATDEVEVVNTTREPLRGLQLSADVYSLASVKLEQHAVMVDAAADDVTRPLPMQLASLMGAGTVFVKLQLHSRDGRLMSENFYWRAAADAGYRALNTLAPASVTLAVHRGATAGGAARDAELLVTLKNTSSTAALATKLVVRDVESGKQVLPAFYSDNYVSLLPGEERVVTVSLPHEEQTAHLRVDLRGWNAVKTSALVTP